MKKTLFTVFILTTIYSCFPWAEEETEKLTEGYYISGNSGFENVHLGFEDNENVGVGLLSQPIKELEYNNKYIIICRQGAI